MVVTLTSVALVLLGQREGDALLALGPLVSTFLGPSPHLSLSEACALASTSLLDWMWSLSCTSEARRAASWRLTDYLRSEPHYYHWQFWKATKVAAERGDLALVSWLVAHFSSCTVSVEVVEAAAKNGHLGVLQFLLEHDAGRYCRHKHSAMTTRAEEVSFQSIPLLKSKGMGRGCHVVHWGGRSIVAAIENGHSDVGRWLYMHAPHELNAEEIRLAIEASLKVGDMELASFLLTPDRRLVDFAYMIGRPEVIEMILDAGILREDPGAAAASIRRLAKSGRLDLMLRIARLHSPPLPPTHVNFDWRNDWFYAAIQACEVRDVEMVKWLVQHPLSEGLCETDLMFGRSSEIAHRFCVASGAGQIETMEFLDEQDLADQIDRSLVRATHNGHLNAVQWIFEPADIVAFEAAVPCVRTFSDDGSSTWVESIVPGYGWCQVQRCDLVFDSDNATPPRDEGISSLRLQFNKETPSISDGLTPLFRAIGFSLRNLTLDAPRRELPTILGYCPNLKELSLCGGVVDARLNFSVYHAKGETLPQLNPNWDSVSAIATALADNDNSLTNCARRIRVRIEQFSDEVDSSVPPMEYECRVRADFSALLDMLKTNRSLDYLDVAVPPVYEQYLQSFRSHHLEPIWRTLNPLPLGSKLAFLSICTLGSEPSVKRPDRAQAQSRVMPSPLDQHVLTIIFEFAADPVLREVYFRTSHRIAHELVHDETSI
ncbi:hypothetical protein PF005_g12598 [Phytophthora fragariae]|uniref:Uncharacterized protein n=1 Tax=Phytophthora fragariae TaxID=53985 RepID=A0A6A4D6T3_9STRA|nr:hypothetical protein PF003_g33747 [Phytophthora fragariae]KAE8934786.1 hypothetical protein PF009_g15242 [Phytophthora fragariae]KAE9003279.1 hypothetical protein PF011_g12962 [Phytophthora fragariae]KAE9103974.1 hypothetical protein PF007_g14208 [Phytophthora fragariae]KAE9141794.1 hypothetical protein PF006_g13047 [Phytophthora fragariae]